MKLENYLQKYNHKVAGTCMLLGHIHYWDGGWRVSVTMAAVCMGVEETGMQQGTGAHTIGLQVRNENKYTYDHCRAINEALALNKSKIEID